MTPWMNRKALSMIDSAHPRDYNQNVTLDLDGIIGGKAQLQKVS